jgi:hypothetical protein
MNQGPASLQRKLAPFCHSPSPPTPSYCGP